MVCMACCWPVSQPKRPRIDRSMIGLPTDFRHTGHIGAGDFNSNTSGLFSLTDQMRSKGGYLGSETSTTAEAPDPMQQQLRSLPMSLVDLPTRLQDVELEESSGYQVQTRPSANAV